MKIIDSKGKVFGLINIIDLIVVVLILVVGAGVGYKYIQGKNEAALAESTECDYTATAIIKEISNDFVKHYNVGEKVYDGAGIEIGTITAIDVSPALRETPTADGQVVNAEVPLRSQLIISFEGSSNFEELKGLKLGKEYKFAGAAIILKNSYITMSAFVTSFDIIKK